MTPLDIYTDIWTNKVVSLINPWGDIEINQDQIFSQQDKSEEEIKKQSIEV